MPNDNSIPARSGSGERETMDDAAVQTAEPEKGASFS
jgi:hypothetical protein